ncbi:MAG: phosphoribosylanthranilate isomerase [Verrucomicrobiales bacterium]
MIPDLVKTNKVGVKICGIRSLDDAVQCINLGADALGINFWAKSKRYVTRDIVEKWIDKLDPKVERIGVFVNESYENIISLIDDGIIHTAQLHGTEDNSFCEKFLDEYKVIRAVGIRDDKSVNFATKIVVKTVLLDTFCGNDFGGSGHTFEWDYAKKFKSKNPDRPVVLAGGLNVSNVTAAIKEVNPSAVDVASGVENENGFKDPSLVERFINSVKGL